MFWELFIDTLAIAGLLMTLIGAFIIFHVVRGQRAPADASNRINKIRLLWFVLTREDMFVDAFPWLKNDELDNITDKVEDKYHIRHEGGGQIALYKGNEFIRDIGPTPGWDFKDRDEIIARYNR